MLAAILHPTCAAMMEVARRNGVAYSVILAGVDQIADMLQGATRYTLCFVPSIHPQYGMAADVTRYNQSG